MTHQRKLDCIGFTLFLFPILGILYYARYALVQAPTSILLVLILALLFYVFSFINALFFGWRYLPERKKIRLGDRYTWLCR